MADGIGRIFGGNNYGVGSYGPQRKEESVDAQAQNQAQPQNNFEETQVDPNKVMDFLANNNYFMPVEVQAKPAGQVGAVDAATEERIAGYMDRFEQIYAIVENDFPRNPEAVMDVVMDKLLGLV